jgi:hypothetical protein
MEVSGILVYEDLEGGFWGIVGNDGSRYELDENPPKKLAVPGTMVEAELKPAGEVSIKQWGKPVKVVSIKRAEG